MGFDYTQINTFILPSREALELENGRDTLPECEVDRTPISSPGAKVLVFVSYIMKAFSWKWTVRLKVKKKIRS